MTNTTINLRDGLTIGDITHKKAELCEYSAGDLIDACKAAEKVIPTERGPVIAASPIRTDMELLCRQVVRIGDHQGPLSMAELRKLSGNDLALLQYAASNLESGAAQAAELRGRISGSQGAD